MPTPGPYVSAADSDRVLIGLEICQEDAGLPEPFLKDGGRLEAKYVRGSLLPLREDRCTSPAPHRRTQCCFMSGRCGEGMMRWDETALAAALEEAQLARFHAGAEAVDIRRPLMKPIVRDFVNRELSRCDGLKSRIATTFDEALSSGLLPKAIAAIVALQGEARSCTSDRLATVFECALATGELARAIETVAAEQDINTDPPIPVDPTAASIFDDSSVQVPPPAPRWLSCSLPTEARPRNISDRKQEAVSSPSTEGNLVFLHVYDLCELTRISGLPLHHIGVEVYRCEYYFSGGGVGMCAPGSHNLYLYKEAVQLGQTTMGRRDWRRAMITLRTEWPAGVYERIGCNCQDFALAVCDILGVSDRVPARYRRLADLGGLFQDSNKRGVVNQALQNMLPSSPCKMTRSNMEHAWEVPTPSHVTCSASEWCSRSSKQVEMEHSSEAIRKNLAAQKHDRSVYII